MIEATRSPEQAKSTLRTEKLAIFSGEAAFAEKLHVGRPNTGNRARLMARINDILDRKWFTNDGAYVREFEERIAQMLGVKNCVAMCNATTALQIAFRALELTGEVIVPSYTFIATAHALQWQGITPVFCDIDPLTHNIDPNQVESLITPQTTAILGVHIWGRPCEIEALEIIARRHNLKLIFDAAHALACSHRGTMIGNFGEIEVFSFHSTKFCNTFEGGAVVTNNDDLARQIFRMKNFGFAGCDNVVSIGINGKMCEISAAMGLTSFECLDEFISINRRNYVHYCQELADVPGLELITYNSSEKSNYQYIVVEVDEALTGISRDLLVKILHAENVIARRYFYPGCHRMEPYRSDPRYAGLSLPETEKLTRKALLLPTGTAIGVEDIEKIGDILRTAVANGAEISKLHSEAGRKQQL